MDIPHSSVRLHQTLDEEDDDCTLLRYLIEEDQPNYELLDDDEEIGSIVAAMDEESTFHRTIHERRLVPRDHADGEARIMRHYFGANPVYTPEMFRRRFRMKRHVFVRILNGVHSVDRYFQQRENCTGLLGLSPLQKVVAAMRILVYGLPADAVDEYVQIGESTAREALYHFCSAVIAAFGKEYLRSPTPADVVRLLQVGQSRGFPGMLGSIECMHWDWRNCPTAWKGMFTGRGKHPSMILEAVASQDLWIWHAYFGLPGSCNDINVLQRSPVFSAYVRGKAPPIQFTVNGRTYDMGYYLADGIYPEWPAFVKSVHHPMERKTEHFAAMQEGARKDIERAFGVLQTRWAVIRGPAYGWERERLSDIMTACIIMHNMIVEDEKDEATNTNFDNIGTLANPSLGSDAERKAFVAAHHKLRDRAVHLQLQRDLIEHNWMRYGSN
ncbi:hypothetical protein EJB05_07130 [Eragrostis curvula]|uniref:DDE Tnp4 domain-containing protein n=1 Tax=Eragrostis curvula TaxID=38414 RepID=A0A5J9WHW3_9POAL|nr:hypothetical protein EJB05_07130 [Eragrostis curvula]